MDLTCEHNKSFFGFSGYLNVTRIKFNDTKTVRVIANFPKGKSNFDVEELKIKNLDLEKFPRGIGVTFPNLTWLKISNCGIKRISREDFTGMRNLKYLNLEENELEELPEDVFNELTQLTWLVLRGNLIQLIHPEVFDSLTKLNLLDLRDNMNIDSEWRNFSKNAARRNLMLFEIVVKCKPVTKKEIRRVSIIDIGAERSASNQRLHSENLRKSGEMSSSDATLVRRMSSKIENLEAKVKDLELQQKLNRSSLSN